MRETIFPYATIRGAVQLTVTEVRADGQVIRADPALLAEGTLDVARFGVADWARLTVAMDVQAQPTALEAYEREHGRVGLTVIASCRPSNVRQAARCERSALDPSCWSATFELERGNFRERVILQGVLSGQANGVAHRPVALTNRWTVYLDPSDSFKIAGSLRVRWCDFKSSSAPPVAMQFPDVPYVVDLDQPLPEILLNLSFEGLEPLLRDSKDRSRIEQALHDSTRMSIARSVWLTLLSASMSAIRGGDEGEDPEWPEREWQTEVLRRVLPEIDSTRTEAELLRLAASEWRAHPGSAAFLSRAEAAMGEIIQANKALRKTVQTLLREGVVS